MNGLVEDTEEEEGWVFSQPAPLSSFSLKPEQWGPSRMSPRTWGSGTEPEPRIRRWRRREGTARASRRAAMSNLHLKLNPASLWDPDRDLLSVLTFSPGLGTTLAAAAARRGGGGFWLSGSKIHKVSLSESVYEGGGQR